MQRVEIITGRERRRRWSLEEKARLVEEAFAPGAIISHVARRHEVAESCLYAWRKRLSTGRNGAGDDAPLLIPVKLSELPASVVEGERIGSDRVAVTLPDGTRLEAGAGYPVPALLALVAALGSRP
ncbi:transposase IS3 [Skermanella stibiiresistens SB22]|uniref:Transposase IS3 n=1 Tax=Skermanella stibiiresistens SB22 TaxID=1385369 RepID=W9GY32_9PROT|nr:transposase [Skermanella stibiiresistens]EWY38699.1 transposase IS3 [Skermanella stibiiresistens SB22]